MELQSYQYVSGPRNNRKLYANGFFYIQEKIVNGKIYWRCDGLKKYGCKSRVVGGSEKLIMKDNHNHEGAPAKLEVVTAINAMKKEATRSRDTPRAIIGKHSVGLSDVASCSSPSVSSLSRTIRRIREKENSGPSVPLKIEDLVIPEYYKKTEKGEEFVLYDSECNDRVIVFGTKRNLELLAKSHRWYMDGTFQTVPNLFYQLYSIHGELNQVHYPLVYALLKNKSEKTYLQFFEVIRKSMESPVVTSITSDFEVSAIKATKLTFPRAENHGCYFHFRQCFYKHVQSSGLKARYDCDADFQLELKLLVAIAFVPVEFVTRAFEIICAKNLISEEGKPIVDYFEDTWIGRLQHRERRKPRFEHSLWNFYLQTLEGHHKTNNLVEGWHRSLVHQFNAKKPSIWKFLEGLRREQALTELKINQQLCGHKEVKTKKYKDKAKRLCSMVTQFMEEFVDTPEFFIHYLKGIANNL